MRLHSGNRLVACLSDFLVAFRGAVFHALIGPEALGVELCNLCRDGPRKNFIVSLNSLTVSVPYRGGASDQREA